MKGCVVVNGFKEPLNSCQVDEKCVCVIAQFSFLDRIYRIPGAAAYLIFIGKQKN